MSLTIQQRSKSAPQPISSLSSSSSKITRSFSQHDLLPDGRLLNTTAVTRSTRSLAYSPRTEREDPFSLAGFFPPSFTPQEEEEEWSWLRGEQDLHERSDLHSTTAFVPTTSGMLSQTQDKLLADTIQSEDKLGVLSLDTLSLFPTREPYDRLFSPYSEDEAVDEDSLYLALCSRRANRVAVPSGRESEFGTLFLPGVASEKTASGSWVAYIYDVFQQLL